MPDIIRYRGTKKSRAKFRVPNTPLNGRITGARVFDARFFKLSDFKAIRALVPGATINDVALAVVSGGMRRYLLAKGQLPQESLVTSVPISIRSAESGSVTEGNELIGQNVLLKTDVEDPVERLQALCDVMNEAKAYVNAVGAKHLSDVSTAMPGFMTGLLARAMTTVAEMSGQSLMANTVVTNVPGVQVPLYMDGAQAVMMCGCGPLVFTMGTIHIIGSYCGQICINITAARDLLPDPGFYADCLKDSFNEYREITVSPARGKKAARKETAPKKRAATRKRAAPGKKAALDR
jgi:WS/DGAT/MGAT family acyltransferase